MSSCLLLSCLSSLLFLSPAFAEFVDTERTFTIDPDTRTFLKDGEPFRYVSGSFHYFRAMKSSWKDIMVKMRGAGLNALQTYVEWSSHEPEPGIYNFDGNLDLVTFIKTAQEVGLLVVFRPGPYICAERDMGGLPYWLMRESPDIGLRSMDPVYIKHVKNWFGVLLPLMKPLLYKNGGPIILVQVENEYGQLPTRCDHEYMTTLRNLSQQYLDKDVILFRTDVPNDVTFKCDSVDGVMVTADFGVSTNVKVAFDVLNRFNPTQPNVVTEYYPGWMDHWGEKHAYVDTESITKTLNDILALNGSVNFYMFYGGTNFGFTSGANEPYNPQPTSYDYDAPITEAGDLTGKFFAIRETIKNYLPVPPKPSPTPSSKLSLGPLELFFRSTLLSSLPFLGTGQPTVSQYPKTFESLSLDKGFLAYSTIVKRQPRYPVILEADGVHDRGYVYVNDEVRGILSRPEKAYQIPLLVFEGDVISIVVENQGRINYGEATRDFKGLISNVTLGADILEDWVMMPLPLNNTKAIHSLRASRPPPNFQPSFYSTSFALPEATLPADTYLDPTGWYRGVAFLNGFNLGRYWPIMGPQVTLYVPKQLIKPFPEKNILTVLELEGTPCTGGNRANCTMNFVTTPILNGTVPHSN